MQTPIFLLLDSRQFGGIESHVLELAKGLRNNNYPVQVVLLQDYGTPHPLEQTLKQHFIHCHKLKNPLSDLISLIARYKPCLLHTHGYKAGIIGRVLGALYRVSVVSSFHAGEKPKGKLAIYDFIDRYSACLAKQRIAVSPIIAARLPFSSHVINNFLSQSKQPLSQGKQLAFVGRLSHEKGADRILELARQLPTQTFHLYGDGPERAALEATASANVQFHGQQDMSNIWPNVGLLLMPSRYEGLPMAAVEAMSYGIPTIAFNVGALDKLIQHQRNGYLIPANDLAAFKQCLNQHLSQADNQAMQLTAQQAVQQHFSATAVLPQLLKLYQTALSH